MRDSPKLLHCPCCEGPPQYATGITGTTWQVYVYCCHCGMRTEIGETRETVAGWWNKRPGKAARVAVWEPGEDDYEGCTVLRDPATDAVLGWYNQADWGACIWAEGEFPGAKRKIAKHAAKNGWEVRDGE